MRNFPRVTGSIQVSPVECTATVRLVAQFKKSIPDKELWLEPKYLTYGTGYMNGRVILGMSRGNERLTKISDPNYSQFGANLLEFGLRTGPNINVREDKSAKLKDLSSWTEDFHIYTTIWNEQGFSFKVDGEDVGRLNPPESGWLNSIASRKHFQSDTMAPYDKEVILYFFCLQIFVFWFLTEETVFVKKFFFEILVSEYSE